MRGKGQGAAFTGLDERVFRRDSLGCIGVVKGKTVAAHAQGKRRRRALWTETVAAARGQRPWSPNRAVIAKKPRAFLKREDDDAARDRGLDGDP